MAESLTVTALRNVRDDLERAIATYQKKIEAAQRDLAHVNATLRLLESGHTEENPTYVDTLRLFKRGEVYALCKGFLEKEGPLDTRELAERLIQHRELDDHDLVLRKSLTYRVVQALRMQKKRGKVKVVEKRKGRIVWQLPQS